MPKPKRLRLPKVKVKNGKIFKILPFFVNLIFYKPANFFYLPYFLPKLALYW